MSSSEQGSIRGGMPKWPTTFVGWCGLILLTAVAVWFTYKNQFDSASVVIGIICWMLGLDNKQAASTAMAYRAAATSITAANSAEEARRDANTAATTAVAAQTAVYEIQNGNKNKPPGRPSSDR